MLGRAWVWLSIATVTLTLVGLSAFVLFALAHHAAPAGGGG
jgi:hypothetical protein